MFSVQSVYEFERCKYLKSIFLTVLSGMGGKLYVVFVGRQPGIYTSWEECHIQVNGYKGAYHCSFPTLREAEDCFRKFQLDKFAYTRVRRNSACGIFMLLFLVFVFFNVLVL